MTAPPELRREVDHHRGGARSGPQQRTLGFLYAILAVPALAVANALAAAQTPWFVPPRSGSHFNALHEAHLTALWPLAGAMALAGLLAWNRRDNRRPWTLALALALVAIGALLTSVTLRRHGLGRPASYLHADVFLLLGAMVFATTLDRIAGRLLDPLCGALVGSATALSLTATIALLPMNESPQLSAIAAIALVLATGLTVALVVRLLRARP